MAKKIRWYWIWVTTSLLFRLVLIYFPKNLNLASRPEVSTPLTSLRRLAEGYWLKQNSVSPYAGSMYHGSPLLLSLLGPLTVLRIEGQPSHLLCSLLLVVADFLTSVLIRTTGHKLQIAYSQSLKVLNLVNRVENSDVGMHTNLVTGRHWIKMVWTPDLKEVSSLLIYHLRKYPHY